MINYSGSQNSVFPSIYQYQSKITFLPRQNFKKDQQNQLQVGLDLKDFGLIPPKKQHRNQSPYQKFIDEFPAHYLDLLPLPQFLYKEQKKQRERNQLNSSLKLPLLKLGKQVETLQELNSQKTQKNSLQKSVTYIESHPSSKHPIQEIKSKSQIDLKQKSSNQNSQKLEKNKRQTFSPPPLLMRLIRKVKQLIIQLSFFQLLVDTLNQKVPQIKSQQREEFKENQDGASKQLYDWLDESLEKFLLELTNYNQLLNLKIGEDRNNVQKKKKIQELLNLFIIGIEKVNVEKHFTKQLALLMNRITQSYQFAPLSYYFKFEIQRLKPTVFGSTGLMEQNQQRMILFSQVLITWQFHPVQDENNQQLGIIQANSTILISILHEIIVKWIEKNVRKIRTLDLDLLKVQFSYLEKPLTLDLKKMEQQGKIYQDNQLIDGIMSSTGIQKYLYNQNGEYDEYAKKLENDMIKIVDKIQEQINNEFQQQNLQKDRIVKLMSMYFSKTLFNKN